MGDAVLRTRQGLVEGARSDCGFSFKNIPYAKPPIGPNRFRPPAAADPWNGVRPCLEFGPACPQIGDLPGIMGPISQLESGVDEDCLNLNVWTPALDEARRPTMVWIHGGGCVWGSASQRMYNGEAFARDGAVLVSVNYRLNALGFLYLDEFVEGMEGSGNLGILDLIAALEWVRDNIASFGGDPDNVTIFGESGGGVCVISLLAAPRARGLFRRAIVQSASPTAMTREIAVRTSRRAHEILEVRPGDLEALQALPADRIVAAASQVQHEIRSIFPDLPALPVAIFPVVGDAVCPDVPLAMIQRGAAEGVDLLWGSTLDEFSGVWSSPADGEGADDHGFREASMPDLEALLPRAKVPVGQMLAAYRSLSPGASTERLALQVRDDSGFRVPMLTLAAAQHDHHPGIWLYRFDWPSPIANGALGAFHILEIPFVFDQLVEPGLHGPQPPKELARTMHQAWINFARCGDPSVAGLPTWPRYEPGALLQMVFNEVSSVGPVLPDAVAHFWDVGAATGPAA
jgi:para-nitrobenzyl esterase